MNLWIPLPNLLAILVAVAVLAWCLTRRPFVMAATYLTRRPAGFLMLVPGVAGVGVMHLLTSNVEMNGWFGSWILWPILQILVAMLQLGGLAALLARDQGKPAGKELFTGLLPVALVSVLVPLCRGAVVDRLHWALGWRFTAWIATVAEFAIDLFLILLAWFVVRWAVNLFIRAVLDIRQPDAQYEVDAQFTAAGQDATVWPLTILLGLLQLAPRLAVAEGGASISYQLHADFPNVLAPMASPWSLVFALGFRVKGAHLAADLLVASIISILLVGFVLAFAEFKKTLAQPTTPAAGAA